MEGKSPFYWSYKVGGGGEKLLLPLPSLVPFPALLCVFSVWQ